MFPVSAFQRHKKVLFVSDEDATLELRVKTVRDRLATVLKMRAQEAAETRKAVAVGNNAWHMFVKGSVARSFPRRVYIPLGCAVRPHDIANCACACACASCVPTRARVPVTQGGVLQGPGANSGRVLGQGLVDGFR